MLNSMSFYRTGPQRDGSVAECVVIAGGTSQKRDKCERIFLLEFLMIESPQPWQSFTSRVNDIPTSFSTHVDGHV